MVTHFLTDLVAQVSALPTIPVLVAQDTVLLALALTLHSRDEGAPRSRRRNQSAPRSLADAADRRAGTSTAEPERTAARGTSTAAPVPPAHLAR